MLGTREWMHGVKSMRKYRKREEAAKMSERHYHVMDYKETPVPLETTNYTVKKGDLPTEKRHNLGAIFLFYRVLYTCPCSGLLGGLIQVEISRSPLSQNFLLLLLQFLAKYEN